MAAQNQNLFQDPPPHIPRQILIFETRIKTKWGGMNHNMSIPIPEILGPRATPAQLRRQYYRAKGIFSSLGDDMQSIDTICEDATEHIKTVAAAHKERKDISFQEFLAEFDLEGKFNLVRAKQEEWWNLMDQLRERLDIDPEAEMDRGSTTGIRSVGSGGKKSLLPKVKIPNFDGSIETWFPFYENFRVLIHEDNSLSKIEKFNFLNSCLEGEAMELIAGIVISDDGYDNAWELIQEKFGDNKRLIRNLNKEITNLPTSSDFDEDEKLYLKVEKICRLLDSLKQNTNDTHYYMLLESKLSPETLDKYFLLKVAEGGDDNWDTSKFRSTFKKALSHIRTMKDAQNLGKPSINKEATMSFPVREGQNFRQTNMNAGNSSGNNNFRKSNSPNRDYRRSQSPNKRSDNSQANQPVQFRESRRSRSPESRNNQQKEQSDLDRKSRQDSPYPRSRSSSGRSNSREKIWMCGFCDGKHLEINCEKFSNAEIRRERCLKRQLCFYCLKKGHFATDCRRRQRCTFCDRYSHHSALCKAKFSVSGPKKYEKIEKQETSNFGNEKSEKLVKLSDITEINCTSCLADKDDKKSILKVIQLNLYNPLEPNISANEFTLLDDGSQRSYIEEDLFEKLKLKPLEYKDFSVSGIGDTNVGTFKKPIVELGLKRGNFNILIKARVLPKVLNWMPLISTQNVPERELERNKLLIKLKMIKPRLLIGGDFYNRFLIKPIKQLPSGFWISDSTVGSILNGEGKVIFYEDGKMESVKDNNFCGFSKDILEEESDFRWKNLAIQQENLQLLDLEDAIEKSEAEITREMKDLITYDGERYTCKLVWNDLVQKLPTNYDMALAQLNSMLMRVRTKPKILEQVCEIFREQEKLGFIERVPDEEINAKDRVIHYLPHHTVYREDKIHTKARQVFNGSAKRHNLPSLNECLSKGENIYNDLCGILIRARLKGILITADIAKAFLQMLLDKNDRDVTRFLWPKDPFDVLSIIWIFRFTRVTFGIICSPIFLALVLLIHFGKFLTELARELERNHYVDNLAFSALKGKVYETCLEVQNMLAQAGMPVREFLSNSPEIKKLPKEDIIDKPVDKFLGLGWDTEKDTFFVKFPKFEKDAILTIRKILSLPGKVFDPKGIVSPVLLKTKIFRQAIESKTTKKHVKWDKPLSDLENKEWEKVVGYWSNQEIHFARVICFDAPLQEQEFSLHVFCDASKIAFGIAVYLRVFWKDKIYVNLIFGKSLIVPTTVPENRRTIPCLELHGTFLGSKYLNYVKRELQKEIKISNAILWTDSADVLEFVTSKNRLNVFVKNRVNKIRNFNIRHVPGKMNPADIASRGSTINELKENVLWWKGPKFLSNLEKFWPESIKVHDPNMVKEEDNSNIIACLKTNEIEILDKNLENDNIIMNLAKNYSSLFKLKIVLCRILKWASKKFGWITSSEMKAAEIKIIHTMQEFYPPTAIEHRQLNLFLDNDGLWRAKGRLGKSGLNFDAINPIFLSRKSPMAKLLVLDAHHYLLHAGVELVHCFLRCRFWIPKGRNFIRNVLFHNFLTKCITCLKFSGKHFEYPAAPDLPDFRCRGDAAFLHVGIDYFGPFYVKGLESNKVWGVIFTCLLCRAIHIEMVTNCSAEHFLLALRRFIRRRRTPETILSDNGSNFILAQKSILKISDEEMRQKREWFKVFESEKINKFLIKNGINWHFNSPVSPWRGGAFERLIQSIKFHLKRTIGRKTCFWEELLTIFVEVERVINERPLTFLSSQEILEPIRPIDILDPTGDKPYGPQLSIIGDDEEEFVVFENKEKSRDKLLITYKKAVFKVHVFWEKWKDCYLTSLREKYDKIHNKTGKFPKIGQVVLVKTEENCPRSFWKLGRINEMLSDRTAIVQIGKKTFERPINILFPLELDEEN